MQATVDWHLANPPEDPADGPAGFDADDEALTKAL